VRGGWGGRARGTCSGKKQNYVKRKDAKEKKESADLTKMWNKADEDLPVKRGAKGISDKDKRERLVNYQGRGVQKILGRFSRLDEGPVE